MTYNNRRRRTSIVRSAGVLAGVVLLALTGAHAAFAAGQSHQGNLVKRDASSTVYVGVRAAMTGSLLPYISGSPATEEIVSQQFASLLHIDVAGNLGPELVNKWWYANKGTQIYMTLDPAAKWSDGTPVTATDVQTAVDFLASPLYNNTLHGLQGYRVLPILGAVQVMEGNRTHVAGFHIVNAHEFYVQLTSADATVLPHDLQGIEPMPSTPLSTMPMSAWSSSAFGQNPTIGDGPYLLSNRTLSLVTMQANSKFILGAPHIPELSFKEVPPVVVPGLLRANELDLYPGLPVQELSQVQSIPGVTVLSQPGANYTFLGWNDQNPVTTAAFRSAILYAIDRKTLIAQVLSGQGVVENGPIPPSSHWYDTALQSAYAYNPQTARDLLTQAGFTIRTNYLVTPSGATFTPTIAYAQGDAIGAKVAQFVVQALQNISINAKVRGPIPVQTFVQELTTHSPLLQGYVMGWQLGDDPDPRGLWRSTDPLNSNTFNWTDTTNPDVAQSDLLIKEQASAAAEVDAVRQGYLNTWQTLISRDAPVDFLYDTNFIGVTSARVHNVAWSGVLGPIDTWTWTLS